jgi:hypothetical protein
MRITYQCYIDIFCHWLALGINAKVVYRVAPDRGANCNRTRGCKCWWNRLIGGCWWNQLIGGKCSGLLEPFFSVTILYPTCCDAMDLFL